MTKNEIDLLKANWDSLGKEDPFWAVLSSSDKRGNKWESSEFFATGIHEINSVMEYLDSFDFQINKNSALDFGCGVGRLTQALANHFSLVVGVDIAKSFIELARQHNTKIETCKFLLNEHNDLALFSDNEFDFIYSNIVLQHMKPHIALQYIKEFLRVMKPDGVLVFQIADSRKSMNGKIKQVIKTFIVENILKFYGRNLADYPKPKIDMFGIRKSKIVKFVQLNAGNVVDIVRDKRAGADWNSYRYCVKKVN